MKFKFDPCWPIPYDWSERLICMWQEDDACRAAGDETRERLPEAFHRIAGYTKMPGAIDKRDLGDVDLVLHRGGWVVWRGCDGEALYRVVKVED